MERSAKISSLIAGGSYYRWMLMRRWDDTLPLVNFIMLNPSTADGNEDDPTIRRCINFAKEWGYGGLVVTNLYAYKATKPLELWVKKKEGIDIIGNANIRFMRKALQKTSMVVLAWGTGAKIMGLHYYADALKNLGEAIDSVEGKIKIRSLGTTEQGFPRHPLYLSKETQLEKFPLKQYLKELLISVNNLKPKSA